MRKKEGNLYINFKRNFAVGSTFCSCRSFPEFNCFLIVGGRATTQSENNDDDAENCKKEADRPTSSLCFCRNPSSRFYCLPSPLRSNNGRNKPAIRTKTVCYSSTSDLGRPRLSVFPSSVRFVVQPGQVSEGERERERKRGHNSTRRSFTWQTTHTRRSSRLSHFTRTRKQATCIAHTVTYTQLVHFIRENGGAEANEDESEAEEDPRRPKEAVELPLLRQEERTNENDRPLAYLAYLQN